MLWQASRGSVRLGGDGKGGAKGGAGGGAAANGTATPGADGAGDDLLPRLPIPDLSATCDRFLEVVAPLLSEKELEETKVVVDDFRRPGGEGEALQSDLKAYDALGVEEGGAHSFVEEFWHHAYLAGRAPLPVHTNPFFVLEDDPTPSRNSQIMRATSLIFSSLKFCYAVRRCVRAAPTLPAKARCVNLLLTRCRRVQRSFGARHVQEAPTGHEPVRPPVWLVARAVSRVRQSRGVV